MLIRSARISGACIVKSQQLLCDSKLRIEFTSSGEREALYRRSEFVAAHNSSCQRTLSQNVITNFRTANCIQDNRQDKAKRTHRAAAKRSVTLLKRRQRAWANIATNHGGLGVRVNPLADIGHSITAALISPWRAIASSLIRGRALSHEIAGKSLLTSTGALWNHLVSLLNHRINLIASYKW